MTFMNYLNNEIHKGPMKTLTNDCRLAGMRTVVSVRWSLSEV